MTAALAILVGWALCLFAYTVYRDVVVHLEVTRVGRAIVAGVLLAIVVAGVASAHTATPSCEALTIRDRIQANPTADIVDQDSGDVVWNDVLDGTYAVPAGTYRVAWSDGVKVRNLEVEQCPQSTPTPTAKPSATPSPTPSRTPSTPPSSSPPASSATPHPHPTLPPTSTATATELPRSPWWMVAAAVVLLAVLIVIAWPERRKR